MAHLDIKAAARAVKRAQHIRSEALARMDRVEEANAPRAQKRFNRAARLVRNALREADQLAALLDA